MHLHRPCYGKHSYREIVPVVVRVVSQKAKGSGKKQRILPRSFQRAKPYHNKNALKLGRVLGGL